MSAIKAGRVTLSLAVKSIITAIALGVFVWFVFWFTFSVLAPDDSISSQEFDMYVLTATRAEHEHCALLGYDVALWMTDTTSDTYRYIKHEAGQRYPRAFACARSAGEELNFTVPPPCNMGRLQGGLSHRLAQELSRQWLRETCNLNIPEFRTPEG